VIRKIPPWNSTRAATCFAERENLMITHIRRGVTLPDHSAVIDGGANIDMRETESIVGDL
jgi:hypothetical protein